MLVIIERIPRSVSKKDLIDFIHPALTGRFFQKSGELNYVKIFSYKGADVEQVVRYYGVLSINSDNIAIRVIKKSNKKKLLGRRVTVRKYYLRSWRNDPRINDDKLANERENMRQGERRKVKLAELKIK
jgi:RNA recognition motif-containing protein